MRNKTFPIAHESSMSQNQEHNRRVWLHNKQLSLTLFTLHLSAHKDKTEQRFPVQDSAPHRTSQYKCSCNSVSFQTFYCSVTYPTCLSFYVTHASQSSSAVRGLWRITGARQLRHTHSRHSRWRRSRPWCYNPESVSGMTIVMTFSDCIVKRARQKRNNMKSLSPFIHL